MSEILFKHIKQRTSVELSIELTLYVDNAEYLFLFHIQLKISDIFGFESGF